MHSNEKNKVFVDERLQANHSCSFILEHMVLQFAASKRPLYEFIVLVIIFNSELSLALPMPSFVPIFLSKSKHHKAIYSLEFISVRSQGSTTARLCIPWKGRDHKNPQVFFRFNSSSTLPNSRETPIDSASAHCTTLGVEAPREGEGKRGDGANGVAAILFVPPLRARSVLRDARFPLPSTVPGPLHCPTPQERGGGSCSSQDCAAGTCECAGVSVGRGLEGTAAGGGAALPAFGGDLTSLVRPLVQFGPACRRHVVSSPGPQLSQPPHSRGPCAASAGPAGFLPLAEGDGGGACS